MIVRKSSNRTLSVTVRPATPVAPQPPGHRVGHADELALERRPVVVVVGEGLLVADRLGPLVGHDRPVVDAVGQLTEVPAVGLAHRADERRLGQVGEVADGARPRGARAARVAGPTPHSARTGSGSQEGELLVRGHDRARPAPGSGPVRVTRGLAASDASLATNFVGGHADRAGQALLGQHLLADGPARCVGPSPSSRRAPVTSRNASSRQSGSTSGVYDRKIAITRPLTSP